MSQLHLVNKNGRRPRPELVKPIQTDQEAAYYAALELVARIDDELTRGVRHYRTTSGQLLNTLDEVIHAILTDTLELPEIQQVEPVWRREMAA
ncbi:MAG: hypothetical protein Kow0031_40820 [Anaerolineae bacterium]